MAVTRPKILEAGGTEVSTAAGGARRYRKPLTAFRWCDIKALLSESLGEWNKHKGPRLGAALAFYTLLSLTPLLLIAVGIAGLVFGREAAQSQIVWQIQNLAGPSGAQAIKALLEGARNTTHGILATALGLLTLLFGASGVLIELRDALNTIWEVPAVQRSGLQNLVDLLKERIFSFALVLAIGFLLLVSLAINACISALGAFSAHAFPVSEGIFHIANTLLSFIVISGLFAAIYRVMPDVRIEWRDVVGRGGDLVAVHGGQASDRSLPGQCEFWLHVWSGRLHCASHRVGVLLRASFFLGAEFTKVFADRYGSQPTRHPEAMVIEKTNPHPTSSEELKIIAPSDLQNRGSERK
jgi:membrane protein